MLTCGQRVVSRFIQMWRTRTRTRSAAAWFARGLVLYVLLLDDHHIMHVFSLQVMRSVTHIMLPQIYSVQLCCVAVVFRDIVCLTTTHNRPTHIISGHVCHLLSG